MAVRYWLGITSIKRSSPRGAVSIRFASCVAIVSGMMPNTTETQLLEELTLARRRIKELEPELATRSPASHARGDDTTEKGER